MADESAADDELFQKLLAELLEATERGEVIDREKMCREHPQYAESICDFLDNNDMVEGAMAAFRDAGADPPVDSAFAPTLDSKASDQQRPFAIGDHLKYIGEYELLDEIARGGMGIVFKARQNELRRTVALKMILAGRLASEADVDRFHREARAAAALQHPNIVGVHEVGQHEGHHYFTMDFVDGESLAHRISQGSLAPRRTAELIKSVAEAIEYAHGRGVLHRDLKPGNILLDSSGQPHVTDFGLAKSLIDDATNADLTATGQILGTPSYMAPEQASAKHQLVSVASDVYSLGAILYACVSGRAPFVADSAVDTIRQVIEKEPVSLRLLNPQVPKDLETICLKCLQKEPHRRYAAAGELAEDLSRFLEGRPVVARPVASTTKLWRWAKRNPWVASLATLSVLLLISGTAVSTYFAIEAEKRAAAESLERTRADNEATAATQARLATEEALRREESSREDAEQARDAESEARQQEAIARQAAEASLANETAARKLVVEREREARWNEYVARMTVIQRPWEDREFGQLGRLAEELVPDADEPDFRGWEWAYYADLVQQAACKIPVSENAKKASWSSDGKRIVTASSKLEVWDATTMERVLQETFDQRLAHAIFGPDDSIIALGLGSGEIALFDLEAGNVVRRWKAHEREANYLSFSPDGLQIASGSMDGSSAIWNADSGQLVHQLSPVDKDNYLRNVTWHPTEPLVAHSDRRGYVRVFDAETGERKFSRRACGISCNICLWSPDGKVLAGGGAFPNYEIRLYSTAGESKGVIKQQASCGAWSPDSTQFARGGDDQDVRIVNAQTNDVLRTTRFHAAPVHHLAWSPDGSSMLSVDSEGVTRVWRTKADVPDARVIYQDDLDVRTVRYSPDGQWIAGACIDKRIRIWRASSGDLVETSYAHTAPVKDVAWSNDNRQVVSICGDNSVRLWDRDAKTLGKPFDPGLSQGGIHIWIDWRPKTSLVACGEAYDDTHVFDMVTRKRVNQTSVRAGYARWSPSGDRLSLATKVLDADLQETNSIDVPAHLMFRTAWSPNGRLIAGAVGDGRITVSDLLADGKPVVARGHRHWASAIAWHPSGTRIATGDHDGVIKIWDAATLDEVWTTQLPHRVLSLDWSPDGRHLVSSDGVDAHSYPTRQKEGDVYSVRIWGTPELQLPSEAPEMLPTAIARALTPDKKNRSAAERILQQGGRVTIAERSSERLIQQVNDLPAKNFNLIGIDLSSTKATDDDVAELHGLSSLVHINFRRTAVTDAAVHGLLQSLPGANLIDLDVSHREFCITPAGIAIPVHTPEEELELLTAAIEQNPGNVREHLMARANWYAKHLCWDEALADLQRWLGPKSRSGWQHCQAAYAALAAGNQQAFRNHLQVNLDKLPAYDFSKEKGTGGYVVCAVCLKPDVLEDLRQLRPLAEQASATKPGAFHMAKSGILLSLRLGEYEAVLGLLESHLDRDHYNSEQILVDSIRAIALVHLDRKDEARAALTKAEKRAGDSWPVPKNKYDAQYGDLTSYIEARTFLNEAQNLMQPAE